MRLPMQGIVRAWYCRTGSKPGSRQLGCVWQTQTKQTQFQKSYPSSEVNIAFPGLQTPPPIKTYRAFRHSINACQGYFLCRGLRVSGSSGGKKLSILVQTGFILGLSKGNTVEAPRYLRYQITRSLTKFIRLKLHFWIMILVAIF